MEKCESCSRTEEKYKNIYGYLTVLLIHVRRATITNKKTPEKEEALHQLAKAANALLNADGGKLLIHVDGQQKWDRDLEVLDEAIGKRFSTLLHDGCQYCDYFTREWLSNVKSFEYADDFLLFGIAKINGVSTLDSKTKMRNDFENVNAPCAVIVSVLQCCGDDETQHPSNIVLHPGIADIPLHEDRATELKTFPPQAACATVESVTNCIWNDLKLKHNITSMAKLPGGGRFCIGVSETPYPGDYKTKTRQINGFNLRVDKNVLIQSLDNKLKTDMLVLTGGGAFREAPSDLIAVHVYPIQGTNKCVLSVNINHFNGIVFHDRAGPEVYTFKNGEICLMSNDIWLQRLLSLSRQPISTRWLTHRSPNHRLSGNIGSCARHTTLTDSGQGNPTDVVKLVLLGVTGSGKSVTGNNILNREIFNKGVSSQSQTRQCQRGEAKRNGREIQIIDTPGMFDTNMTIGEIAREVATCVWMTIPGIHAFVLVIKVDRFTITDETAVESFLQIFGDAMMDYLIILFTRKDDLIHENLTIEEFIQKAPDKLKALLLACKSRFVCFNNRAQSENERDQDVQSLLNVVDKMVSANGGKCYSNWMYVSAERIMKDSEEQLKLEQMMEVKKMKDSVRRKLKEKHEKAKAETSEIVAQLQQRLQDLKQKSSDHATETSEIHTLKQEILDYKRMVRKHQREYEEECVQREQEIENTMYLKFRETFREEMVKGAQSNMRELETALKMFATEVTGMLSTMLGVNLELPSNIHDGLNGK